MRRALRRVWFLIRRRQLDADLSEEIEFHRKMKEQELRAGGLSDRDAARAAERALGSTALAHNHARDVWVWSWLQDLAQDLRFAARLLGRDRRFTLAAVVALTLGIAANTTIFTFINTALFKDLPFDEPRQLMALGTRDTRGPIPDGFGPRRDGVSYPDFLDWRSATRAFAGLAAETGGTMNLSEEGLAPERLNGTFVSTNVFDVLRVKPALGRAFLAGDDRPGAPPVMLLGDDVWQRRYGRDPAVIGRLVRINNIPMTVVGVMPPAFKFPFTAEVWQPLSQLQSLGAQKRDARRLQVFGRLADDVTVEQARAELDAIAERLAVEHPDTNRNIRGTIAPPMEQVRRGSKPFLMTLMGAVGFVLLIACANVANLLLARAAGRSREIAIRASLGATRWRIVRQLLIESLLLASIAGVLALVLSVYGVRYFGVAFDAREVGAPDQLVRPYWVDLSMDFRVFAFVAAVCLGASIAFGLAPALHVSKTDVNASLKAGGRAAAGSVRTRRWTAALMIVELSLTVVLLTGAGLLLRSFVDQYRTDLVLDTTNVLAGRVALPIRTYPTFERQLAFVDRLNTQLAASPALVAATVATDVPLVTLGSPPRQLSIDGQTVPADGALPTVAYVRVGDRYFETLGLRLVQGRGLGSGRPAEAVVNERFAMRFFPAGAVGKRIQIAGVDGSPVNRPWLTIVGVAQALPQFGPAAFLVEPLAYVPLGAETEPLQFVSIIVRGRTGPSTTVPQLREAVRLIDPDLPLFAVQTMDDSVAQTRFGTRVIGSLFGFLALNALVLASVGLFALTAHGVAQRTQEIGIRMALGARALQVTWLFVRRMLVQLAVGLALGLTAALALGQLLRASFTDGSPRDPLTLASVAALLVVVSLIACLLPARRAARLNPVVALRHE